MEGASDALVSVLYYCPCSGTEPKIAGDGISDGDKQEVATCVSDCLPVQPNSELLPLCTSPIESMYYCDHCNEVRCSRCVIDEPSGYHCPNCLFDVPTASVRSEKNCCARNCFECPVCTHVLSVVENDIEPKPFSLACSVCFWDSREIGWEFEKATGISAQIEHIRAGDPQAKEYVNLLDYWRTVHRISSSNSGSSTSTDFDSYSLAGTSFKHRFGISALAAPVANTIPEYKAAAYIETDHEHLSDLMAVENADYISPNMVDPTSKEPRRIRLHMKLSRRCRICHHILIKPESKAQATRFKIQLVASNYLPKITLPDCLSPKSSTVQPEFPLHAGAVVPVILRFANPLYSKMKVRVSTDFDSGDDEGDSGAVAEVVAQEFVLSPFTELWEYDEDDDAMASDIDGVDDSGNPASTKQRGIVERQGSRIAIQVNVMPKAKTSNLIVPLRVVCTHQDDIDLDIDASNPSDKMSTPRIVTNRFWVYISLGPVI